MIFLTLCLAASASASPEKAFRYYSTGVFLLSQGNYREAVKELKRAVHEDFEFADAHAKLADAYSGLNTIEGRRLAVEQYRLAIRYDPENPDYHLAIGKVYVGQTFDRYAEKSFRETIAIDPDRTEAYLESGFIHIRRWRQYWGDGIEKAYNAFMEAYDRGSTDRDLLYHLGQVAIEREKPDLAEEMLQQILDKNPEDTEARFQYALALHEQEKLEEAEEHYLRAIAESGLRDKTTFLGIDDVASHGLLRELKDMDAEDAARIARYFWREHDPYLSTSLNERLLEHWRRVLKADFYYSVSRLSLSGRESARGQSYIRYGPPTGREAYIDDGDRPVEVWSYNIGGRHFKLTFRDRFLNGEFGFPFDPRGGPAAHWQALLRQFPEYFVPEYEGTQIRMIADACSFLREKFWTHQEIYYSFPGRELSFHKSRDGWRGEILKRMVLYDQDWNIVAEESLTVFTESSGSLELLRERSLVDQSTFKLKPGRYLAAVSIEDTLADVMGLAEIGLTARSFDWDGLRLSDIELARSIRPSSDEGRFSKNGLRVEPEPARTFSKGDPVHIYYEVYGLGLDQGQSRFKVTVRVIPLQIEQSKSFWEGVRKLFGGKPRTPPHIASTFSYQSSASALPQHLSLDVTKLRPGRYRLTVGVEDVVAEAGVSRSTVLWVTQ